MRRTDDESEWSEYLLYSPGKRFLWLIETDDGWQRAEVLDRWPVWDSIDRVTLQQLSFQRSYEYDSRVVCAAGSFNWRVKVGDAVHVREFVNGPIRLAAETSAEEMTWSRSSVIAADQVWAWFGKLTKPVTASASEDEPVAGYRSTARRILFPMFLVNAIPVLLSPGRALIYTLLAAAAIYLPAYLLDSSNSRD